MNICPCEQDGTGMCRPGACSRSDEFFCERHEDWCRLAFRVEHDDDTHCIGCCDRCDTCAEGADADAAELAGDTVREEG